MIKLVDNKFESLTTKKKGSSQNETNANSKENEGKGNKLVC